MSEKEEMYYTLFDEDMEFVEGNSSLSSLYWYVDNHREELFGSGKEDMIYTVHADPSELIMEVTKDTFEEEWDWFEDQACGTESTV